MTAATARPERRAVETLGTTVPRLRSATVAAVQEPTTRHAQLRGDGTRQQLRLVVPATAGALAAGRRPRDHIDPADAHPTHHEPGQLTGDQPAVAVLQTVHDLAGHAFERQRSHDAGLADLGRCAGEREATAVAQGGTGLVAAGAECGEEHGGICTRGV